jgi:hypothetical protein
MKPTLARAEGATKDERYGGRMASGSCGVAWLTSACSHRFSDLFYAPVQERRPGLNQRGGIFPPAPWRQSDIVSRLKLRVPFRELEKACLQ